MRTRRLSLRRETLTALSDDDLANVAGAVDHTLELRCILTTPSVLSGCESVLPCHTSPCTN